MSFPDLHLMHAIFFIILQELSVTLKKDSRGGQRNTQQVARRMGLRMGNAIRGS